MSSLGHQWSKEFGHPWFVVWLPPVMGVAFLGFGIEALADSKNQDDYLFAFMIFWNLSILFWLVGFLRSLHATRFRVRVTSEGIETLRPNPTFKAEWHEIAGVKATAESLVLTAAGGEIVVPRSVPEYTELYKVISDHVRPSVLHATSGLPLVLHYRSSSVGSLVLGAVGFAGWFAVVSIGYRTGHIPPLWYGLALAFPLLGGLQDLYRRSKRYEFHADRIIAKTAFRSKEYLKSELKDGYLDEAQHDEVTAPVLRLVFTNGDELELSGGSITVEELHRVLKAHYSLI